VLLAAAFRVLPEDRPERWDRRESPAS
jgi:hypothetical protein